jgi:hypothetical protein
MLGMSSPVWRSPRDKAAYVLAVLASLVFIVLLFFKFVPDLGNGVVQNTASSLTSLPLFVDYFMSPGSVHHARFLGNHMVADLATRLVPFVHTSDVRLHPLRVAATLLTMGWFLVAMAPVHLLTGRINWQAYLPVFGLMFMAGQYVYYPCDAPSIALLAVSLALLLREQMLGALVFMLLTGLFRESSFHMVIMVGTWAWVANHQTRARRALWLLAFALCFVLEYKLIRVFFPGDPRGVGWYSQVLSEPARLLFGGGLWSLTTLMTLPLALLFPVACWLLQDPQASGWERQFFRLSCLAFPVWLIIYRVQGGNISEFRMMWPAMLPCVLGLAWQHTSSRNK